MVLAEFAMFPTDKGASVSQYVSKIIDLIDKSGVSYQLTPMGTILEGEWTQVNKVISDCFILLQADSDRIYSSIKIDYRKDRPDGMKSKTAKIEERLNRKVVK